MSFSKHFKNSVDISKLIRSMVVGDSVYLEIQDGVTQQQALNAVTACSAVRKNVKRKTEEERKRKKYNIVNEKATITTQYLTALGARDLEKPIRLIKVTKTSSYMI